MSEWHHTYTGSGAAHYIDDEGRIVDRLSNRTIGICTEKKNEILADYDVLSNENIALKQRLDEIENALERHKNALPEEIKTLIQKPPTVESLQGEIADLKNLIINMMNERGGTSGGVNSGAVQKTRAKPGNTAGSGTETERNGDKPE